MLNQCQKLIAARSGAHIKLGESKSAVLDVDMRIDDAGEHASALGVNDFSLRPDQIVDVVIGADAHDHAIADGKRLHLRLGRFARPHRGVANDEIRMLSFRGRHSERRAKNQRQ